MDWRHDYMGLSTKTVQRSIFIYLKEQIYYDLVKISSAFQKKGGVCRWCFWNTLSALNPQSKIGSILEESIAHIHISEKRIESEKIWRDPVLLGDMCGTWKM